MTNTWENIIGHEWAVELLQERVRLGRVNHAYLFTGPDQIGKTTLATTFTQALNCTESDAPCGNCRACTLISSGKHPDLAVLTPEANARGKLTIKIEAIRTLQRSLQLSRIEAKYKVAIIERFDTTTIGAANAFLKTLEEPPQNVILMLTAVDADTMLDTIRSRCHVLNLRPLPTDTIRNTLISQGANPTTAQALAQQANGRIGWAIQTTQNPDTLTKTTDALTLLQEIIAEDTVGRFKHAETLAKKPENLAFLLNTWTSLWRDTVISALGQPPSSLSNLALLETIGSIVTTTPLPALQASLTQTQESLDYLGRNANTRLVLENLFLTYPQPRK